MGRQIRVEVQRRHRVSTKSHRLKRLIRRLREDERLLVAALDASKGSIRGVENASFLRLWQLLTSLTDRRAATGRALKRLKGMERTITEEIRRLRVALTHLFHVCPVDEPRWYMDDFGVLMRRDENGVITNDRTRWRHHRGVDIFSVAGTPVRAPFPGWAQVATNPVGGLAVKVFGARGFVYNAHLLAYGHLGRVEEGTIIGYVGNSGDARGTRAHNHFEWHPFNGPAVDPYRYLNEACR
jgi:murein DD-endopeptidase MepM/ murein hydrolase activator NlpD